MTVAAGVTCVASPIGAQSSLIGGAADDCIANDGERYFFSTQYVRGVSLYQTENYTLMTHCEKGFVLRVGPFRDHENGVPTADDRRAMTATLLLRNFIPRREDWTFQEARNMAGGKIEQIVPDGCICEDE